MGGNFCTIDDEGIRGQARNEGWGGWERSDARMVECNRDAVVGGAPISTEIGKEQGAIRG